MLKKERCSICNDVVHILSLLQCNETQKWQEKLLAKWLHIHEEISYKIIGVNKSTE